MFVTRLFYINILYSYINIINIIVVDNLIFA
jgi:hypothetical protein